jgi:predicted enzyme involved in methoxymalonyl-ACP biosynthesis
VRKEKQAWTIDSFLMSCRVIGLTVETAFLHRIYQDACEAHVESLVGEFVPTQKNQPAKDFYPRHGFSIIKESDGLQLWNIEVTGDTIKKPQWITTGG